MKKEKYTGDKVYLRLITESDITERYLDWFRDEDVTFFLEAKNLNYQEVVDYFKSGHASGAYYIYAICLVENDLHVGNVKIGPINPKHKTSGLPTFIGDKAYWGKGIATEAIRIATAIAFDEFDIRKMTGGMYSTNHFSKQEFVDGGWYVEGILKGHYELNGELMDRLCVACLNPKFFDQGFIDKAVELGSNIVSMDQEMFSTQVADSEQSQIYAQKVLEIALETFPASGELSVEANKDSVVEWDSLGNLSLFTSIEEAYDLEFDQDDYLNAYSLKDIVNILVSRLG